MAGYFVTIRVESRRSLAALIREHGIDLFPDHIGRAIDQRPIEVRGIASTEQIKALKAAGYRVERGENVEKGKKARLAEVGRGDRYAERLKRLRGEKAD